MDVEGSAPSSTQWNMLNKKWTAIKMIGESLIRFRLLDVCTSQISFHWFQLQQMLRKFHFIKFHSIVCFGEKRNNSKLLKKWRLTIVSSLYWNVRFEVKSIRCSKYFLFSESLDGQSSQWNGFLWLCWHIHSVRNWWVKFIVWMWAWWMAGFISVINLRKISARVFNFWTLQLLANYCCLCRVVHKKWMNF